MPGRQPSYRPVFSERIWPMPTGRPPAITSRTGGSCGPGWPCFWPTSPSSLPGSPAGGRACMTSGYVRGANVGPSRGSRWMMNSGRAGPGVFPLGASVGQGHRLGATGAAGVPLEPAVGRRDPPGADRPGRRLLHPLLDGLAPAAPHGFCSGGSAPTQGSSVYRLGPKALEANVEGSHLYAGNTWAGGNIRQGRKVSRCAARGLGGAVLAIWRG